MNIESPPALHPQPHSKFNTTRNSYTLKLQLPSPDPHLIQHSILNLANTAWCPQLLHNNGRREFSPQGKTTANPVWLRYVGALTSPRHTVINITCTTRDHIMQCIVCTFESFLQPPPRRIVVNQLAPEGTASASAVRAIGDCLYVCMIICSFCGLCVRFLLYCFSFGCRLAASCSI